MSEEDVLRKIEARLAKLESGFTTQHPGFGYGPVVDPVPWPWYGGGWGGGGWGGVRPGPVVDPAVFSSPFRFHSPSAVDFVPWHWGPSVDPATFAGAAQQQQAASAFFRRPGPVGDPPPIDVSRFSIEQLEAALHSISAEKARLNSVETMLRQQLDKRREE